MKGFSQLKSESKEERSKRWKAVNPLSVPPQPNKNKLQEIRLSLDFLFQESQLELFLFQGKKETNKKGLSSLAQFFARSPFINPCGQLLLFGFSKAEDTELAAFQYKWE